MDEIIAIQTAREARSHEGGGHRLERAARTGQLVRLRRGVYAARDDLAALDGRSLHLARVASARAAAAGEPTFSHESAAAIHGIPLIGDWPEQVRTTVPPSGQPSTGPVRRTQRVLDETDIAAQPDGLRVTSLCRTAIDLAASRSLLSGIVAVSHVRALGIPLESLRAGLDRAGAMAGIRRARLAVARSVAAAESVLEVLVVVRCQDLGFEVPELQRWVTGVDGRNYRVDFAWRDGRVLCEADGRGKYVDPALLAGRSGDEVLWIEKRREDALRPVCDAFIRASWDDAWAGDGLARRLTAAGVPRSSDKRLGALTF